LPLEPDCRPLPLVPRLCLFVGVDPGDPLQLIDDAHRLNADGADALQQVDDPLLVVGKAVSVEALPDGGVPRRLFLVLVQHPFQRPPAPQAVLPRLVGYSLTVLILWKTVCRAAHSRNGPEQRFSLPVACYYCPLASKLPSVRGAGEIYPQSRPTTNWALTR